MNDLDRLLDKLRKEVIDPLSAYGKLPRAHMYNARQLLTKLRTIKRLHRKKVYN